MDIILRGGAIRTLWRVIVCVALLSLFPSGSLFADAWRSAPDYDSGWVAINKSEGRQFFHDLGGDPVEYVVILDYRSKSWGINHQYYGSADFGSNPPAGRNAEEQVGVFWHTLTDASVVVYRNGNDVYGEEVRVRIWIDDAPDFDSDFLSVTAGFTRIITHSLGGFTDYYVVDMQMKDLRDNVTQAYYGGLDFGAQAGSYDNSRLGAYWYGLDDSIIKVYRRPEDEVAQKIRIRIWIRERPTRDSGWVDMSPGGTHVFPHTIGGNPEDYVVDVQFKNSLFGVNQINYGGNHLGDKASGTLSENDRVGAYWRNLGAATISLYRLPEDVYAEQMRVRIWNFWRPGVPDYESGWTTLTAGTSTTTFTHDVGGSTDDYYVDLQQKAPVYGVNNCFQGGADLGSLTDGGTRTDDRVGVYWQSLTNESISLLRRAEDHVAAEARVRIWKMPRPDYNTGWFSMDPGETARTFSHYLGGAPGNDYLVDLQQRHPTYGVNQMFMGSAHMGANSTPGTSVNDLVGSYWIKLTGEEVTTYREEDDPFAPEMRLRIWRIGMPNYTSRWNTIDPGTSTSYYHRLGGDPDRYFVNMMTVWVPSVGVNGWFAGGLDMGANPLSGHSANDRIGIWWERLDKQYIHVFRREEDTHVPHHCVKIWYVPTGITVGQIRDHTVERHLLTGGLEELADTNIDGAIDSADIMFLLTH